MLCVRTGNGGTDPKFLIKDLGYAVRTGVSWKALSYIHTLGPGNPGQFSEEELKDSIDLYNAINDSDLEWSKDCVNEQVGWFHVDTVFGLERYRVGVLFSPTNGSNVVFTTAEKFRHDPTGISLSLYHNGQRLVLVDDYTVSESGGPGAGFDTITLAFTPLVDDRISGDYITDIGV